MAGRLAHADEWIGDAGFRVPDLGGDWRQPLYVPALPSVARLGGRRGDGRLGARVRARLQDARERARLRGDPGVRRPLRSPRRVHREQDVAGGRPRDRRRSRRHAPRRRRAAASAAASEGAPEAMRPMGSVRFLQLLPVTIYSASGIAKARGDWLTVPLVLWSHLHDSYQTAISVRARVGAAGLELDADAGARRSPSRCWRRSGSASRAPGPYALVFGLGMHAMIGLCFGPVLWFALLMMTLLVGGYLPERLLEPLDRLADRLETPGRLAAARVEPGAQQPQSWMQSGSPAHSVSHCLSQVLTLGLVPAARVGGAELARRLRRMPARTRRGRRSARTGAAWPGRTCRGRRWDRALRRRGTRGRSPAPAWMRKPQPDSVPWSTETPGHRLVCSQSVTL